MSGPEELFALRAEQALTAVPWRTRDAGEVAYIATMAVLDAQNLSEEYVIVHDGDPKMDGTYERREIGRFTRRVEAERAFVLVSERSVRAPKQNLRIERRLVSPWEAL